MRLPALQENCLAIKTIIPTIDYYGCSLPTARINRKFLTLCKAKHRIVLQAVKELEL
jgi:hypothetical protein